MVFDFTTRSFSILFSAVPMWTSPLAKGGPSCRTKSSAPARACLDSLVKALLPPTCRRISGSRVARSAFIGKSVFGRLSVSL